MRDRVQAEGGRHADPRDPAQVLGAQPRRRGADVPRGRARPLAEGLHGMGGVRAGAALADGGARHAGHARGTALPHRHPRRGEARLLPPLPRVQGLWAHAGDGGKLRGRVHAQRDARGAGDEGGRVRQHGVRLGRPRAAPRDVRGARVRRARRPPRRRLDAGLALPADGRLGRGGRVREVVRGGRGALLQPQPPRRTRRPAVGRGRPGGGSSTRSWASTPRPRTSRSSGCSPRAPPALCSRSVRSTCRTAPTRRRPRRPPARCSPKVPPRRPRAPWRRVCDPPPAPPPARGARPGRGRVPRAAFHALRTARPRARNGGCAWSGSSGCRRGSARSYPRARSAATPAKRTGTPGEE